MSGPVISATPAGVAAPEPAPRAASGTARWVAVPGNYLLRLTWAAEQCTPWYRVDLTRGSNTEFEVLMDVDCAHGSGRILDPYRG